VRLFAELLFCLDFLRPGIANLKQSEYTSTGEPIVIVQVIDEEFFECFSTPLPQ